MRMRTFSCLLALIFSLSLEVGATELLKEEKRKCQIFAFNCFKLGLLAPSPYQCRDTVAILMSELVKEGKVNLASPVEKFRFIRIMRICREVCESSRRVTPLEVEDLLEEKCELFERDLNQRLNTGR